jgi:DNA polymerase elongation subunit (family B)
MYGYQAVTKCLHELRVQQPYLLTKLERWLEGRQFYETKVDPVASFMAEKQLSGGTWVELDGDNVSQLKPLPDKSVHAPLHIICFDIETINGTEGETVGSAEWIKGANVIQVGCYSTDLLGETEAQSVLFMTRTCAPGLEKEGIEVKCYDTEGELLGALFRYWEQQRVHVFSGYNSDRFDMPVLIERAKICNVTPLTLNGYTVSYSRRVTQSKQQGARETVSYDCPGIIMLDLLPLIMSNEKLRSYKLNDVCMELLEGEEQKDDVSYKEIKPLYDGTDEDRRRLGHYCMQDVWLVWKLIDKRKLLLNLLELSRALGCTVYSTATRGQSFRLLCKVLHTLCAAPERQYVIETLSQTTLASGKEYNVVPFYKQMDREVPLEYQGATVLEPTKGLHDDAPVLVLDFKSLYPSIMLAYNMCHTTLLHTADPKKLKEMGLWYTALRRMDEIRVARDVLRAVMDEKIITESQFQDMRKTALHLVSEETLCAADVDTLLSAVQTAQNMHVVCSKRQKTDVGTALTHGVFAAVDSMLRVLDDLCKKPGSDVYISPNGYAFVQSHVREGVLPHLLRSLLDGRVAAKKQMKEATTAFYKALYDGKQLALKVICNSMYGILGALTGTMQCIPIASSVTATGRRMIEDTSEYCTKVYSTATVYGDTDSVFIKPNTNMSIEEAFELGERIEKSINVAGVFKEPNYLEFEKVMKNLLLVSKKKYAAKKFEGSPSNGKLNVMGLECARRDNFSFLVDVQQAYLIALCVETNKKAAKSEVSAAVKRLTSNQVPLEKLTVSKKLARKLDDYANKQVHAELAKRMKLDPERVDEVPVVGDRVPYVIVQSVDPNRPSVSEKRSRAPVTERGETPMQVQIKSLKVDTDYYMESLQKAMTRIIEPVEGYQATKNLFHTSRVGPMDAFLQRGI